MKRLKIQFTTFFLLLAVTLTLLLTYSYTQIDKEEQRLWQGIAENVYNQMQSHISNFLTQEDQRSFSEYRYFYIPKSQVTQSIALNVSPLAKIPQNDPRGLVGYFQIDPNGKFHTPYMPPKNKEKNLKDLAQRELLQKKLSDLTQSLQSDVINRLSKEKKDEDKFRIAKKNFIELGTLTKPIYKRQGSVRDNKTKGSGGYVFSVSSAPAPTPTRKTIYPNPLKKRSKYKVQKQKLKEPTVSYDMGGTSGDKEEEQDDLKQEVTSNIAQYQTFKQQKITSKGLTTGEEGSDKDLSQKKPLSIFTDPFRARLVDWKDIVFYRKVWVDQKMYIQGFVVRLKDFYNWLMDLSFENSQLPNFALASLKWENKNLTQNGQAGLKTSKIFELFQRNLGYPLNQFTWHVAYKKLPNTTSRTLLNGLTMLLAFIATAGLYLIYRSTASEVLLSQKRQDFVSAVTHELKTPLTSIRMYSEMLSEDWVEDEAKKKEYYDLMTREGDRLSRLIDNVLHLARLEKRNYRFNMIKASPNKDFESLSKELQDLTEQKGFEWQARAEENLAVITYDPEAVKQILIILIDNSIKFSTEAKEKIIEMNLKKEADNIVWSIADRGPGVSPKDLNKIFEQFHRIENEMTRKTKGTGIGLAMARMLMQGMGGKIEAKNRTDGGLIINLKFKIS